MANGVVFQDRPYCNGVTCCFQMVELVLFIMILVVFLLAYGISSQALMYPQRDFYPLIFRDIFYYPYWQIYGELWLEELEGQNCGIFLS